MGLSNVGGKPLQDEHSKRPRQSQNETLANRAGWHGCRRGSLIGTSVQKVTPEIAEELVVTAFKRGSAGQ